MFVFFSRRGKAQRGRSKSAAEMSSGHPPSIEASAVATEGVGCNDVSPISPESLLFESVSRFLQPSSHLLSSQLDDTDLPTALKHRRTSFLNFGWWWELGAMSVGTICMCMTVAILSYMNGRSLRAWGLPIQPNSLIAVFSAITKSALLVPIAECISQLKWIYYDKPRSRPVSQVQYFEDASRGPWGSTVLFWKTREAPPLLALLGAGLTIIMLLFEPFVQQVLDFPSHMTLVSLTAASMTTTLAFPTAANKTLVGRRGK